MNEEVTELQNDDTTDEVIENTTESAPEEKNEPTPEEVEADKKVKAQEAFNKQYGKAKQAERERDAALDKLKELEASQSKPPPEVGSFPNEFDYDTTEQFEQAKVNYTNAIKQNAAFETQQQTAIQNQQHAQQQAQQAQAQTDADMAAKLITEAKSNNITEVEVQQHAQSVINYGINPDVFRLIAGSEDGSLMLKHLAANSQDVAAISTMNPFEVGNYINTVIKPKASELKPKPSNAPPPTDDIQGGSVDLDSTKFPHIKGAKFE